MNNIALPQRKFSLKLAPLFIGSYQRYLFYLKRLLQRLGQKQILSLWRDNFTDYDDKLTNQIISTGWEKCASRAREKDEEIYIKKYI